MQDTTSVSMENQDKSDSKAVTPEKKVTLLFGLCITFGTIVGSGIFTSVKASFTVFGDNKPIGMVLLFWLLAGIISIVGGLCYTELGTRIPESGGERAYFSKLLTPKMSRVFIIFYVFIIKSLTVAGLCIATGRYVCRIFTDDARNNTYEILIGQGTLLLCVIVNCFSKTIALKTGVALSVLKTLAMVIIIICGIVKLCKGEAQNWDKPFTVGEFSFKGLVECMVSLFWSYEGWSTLGLIVGEMKNPARDLPRAIIGGVSVVTVFYVATVASYNSILGYDEAKKEDTVAAKVSQTMMGKAKFIMPLLISCSTIGGVNGYLYSISSACSSAGYSGNLPKIFSLVQRTQRTPIFSLICIGIISSIYMILDFDTIMQYCAFLSWTFYFIALCCLWKIKIQTRKEKIEGIFRAPYFLILPIQLVCLFVVIVSFKDYYIASTIFAIIFILTFVVQYIPQKYATIPELNRFQDFAIAFLHRFGLELADSSDIS